MTVFKDIDVDGWIYIVKYYRYIISHYLMTWGNKSTRLTSSLVGLNDLSLAHRFDKAVSASRIARLNLREVAREFSTVCPVGEHLGNPIPWSRVKSWTR